MPYSHSVTRSRAEELQGQVMAILDAHSGADRAIKARAIAGQLGLRSDRTVREAIRQLRRKGHLIISSVGERPGYFLAETMAEWNEFAVGNLKPRAFDILETASAMQTAAQRKFGTGAGQVLQLEMFV